VIGRGGWGGGDYQLAVSCIADDEFLCGRLDLHLFFTGYYASAGIYLGVRF
jgi:hypothetical protein